MRLSTPALAAIIAVLLLGLVGLNMAIKPPGDEHEEEPPAAAKTEEKTAADAALDKVDQLVHLPVDSTAGPQNAHDEVTVGWIWTPEVQADPQLVFQAIQEVRKAAPGARVRIVNGDAVPEAPLGIRINGKTVLALPANGLITPDKAREAVQQALAGHAH